MKKIIVVGTLLICAFFIGLNLGRLDVIKNQTIYNEKEDSGVYCSEYKGQVHIYDFK